MRLLLCLMAALLGLPASGDAEQPLLRPAAVSGAASSVMGGLGTPAAGAAGHYRAPVNGSLRILRGFSPPANPYGPGHLGLDLAVAGGRVLAAGSGTVRFAGQVAGRGVLVIQHPDGISTEYEPIKALVRAGARVVEGQPIGRLAGTHRGCPAPACLHWGARRGGRYLDPISLLQPLGVVRLLPWDWVAGG
jgi:murein DD-endopeptidase MepM/ murein hydrolase activator NlpD